MQGNIIGTNAAGLGNAGPGIFIFNGATNHVIGGSAAGAGNVISGNSGAGISVLDTASGNASMRTRFTRTAVSGSTWEATG